MEKREKRLAKMPLAKRDKFEADPVKHAEKRANRAVENTAEVQDELQEAEEELKEAEDTLEDATAGEVENDEQSTASQGAYTNPYLPKF